MGTNYYVVKNKPSVSEPIHIGKSSAGWLFLFQAQDRTWDGVAWNDYDQLKQWLKTYTVERNEYVIVDEYDEIVSYDDFICLVESKQNDEWCCSNPDNFRWCHNINGYRFTTEEFG